jgi:hypothetical protein
MLCKDEYPYYISKVISSAEHHLLSIARNKQAEQIFYNPIFLWLHFEFNILKL